MQNDKGAQNDGASWLDGCRKEDKVKKEGVSQRGWDSGDARWLAIGGWR